MGIAAYNRGSKAIAESIRASYPTRAAVFEIIDRANSLPKYPDAGRPFGPINFEFSHGGCWATCPITGFGYWYPTLYEAVRRWQVTIVAFRNGAFEARVNEICHSL